MAVCEAQAAKVLLVVCALVLAACTSDGGETPQNDDADATSTSSTPAGSTGSSTADGDDQLPALTTTRFQTPSEKIVCESFSASLVCVPDYPLNPEPSSDFCPVDWIGVFIQVNQFAGPSCSGDPGISRDPATTLEYGQTWELGGVACTVEKSGLTCRDEHGNGFTLATAGWSLLGKEDAASAASNELRRMVRTQAREDLPGQVARLDAPVLRSGDDCGELQQAFVPGALADGGPLIYEACYVSGTWFITAGPLFPD
jgi:hypothetical protein